MLNEIKEWFVNYFVVTIIRRNGYAFRPTGSTTAAIIAILHTVRSMLSTNEYVHVLAFDFSKAFDTVRHSTLMNKLATMQLPDSIYNWVRDFFTDRHHCTRYADQLSTVAAIKASVIQGSGLGPASYVVTAADLHPCTTGNRIFKYADDTYLVVPTANSSTRCQEIEQIGVWAAQNNLKLNSGKTKEWSSQVEASEESQLICPLHAQASSWSAASAFLASAADHVNSLLASSKSLVYALRVLRVHGIPDVSLQDTIRYEMLF